MRFVVTNESDYNVFYSAPTMAELKKAGRHSHYCYYCEEAQRRRQYLDEAFMLFSKHFNDLWW